MAPIPSVHTHVRGLVLWPAIASCAPSMLPIPGLLKDGAPIARTKIYIVGSGPSLYWQAWVSFISLGPMVIFLAKHLPLLWRGDLVL